MPLCQTPFYAEMLAGEQIPNFYKIKQQMPDTGIKDIPGALYRSAADTGLLGSIAEGEKVAIAVGSREYSNMVQVVKTVVDMVKSRGGRPYLVPAMGSHGGCTAEGQQKILLKLGLTPENVGATIRSSMDTVVVGQTASGMDVHMDKNAFQADKIVAINRVKAHTDFVGPYESGLMKIMAIGLGKQHGANICHKMGFPSMSQNIHDFGNVMLQTGKFAFFVALLENEVHQIFHLELVAPGDVEKKEPALLALSKQHLPSIPFEKVDIIMLDRVGKDFSGSGADPHVTGRSAYLPPAPPFAQHIVAFDLTDKSSGTASGMGLLDVVPMRFYQKVDFDNTYLNAITATDTIGAHLPVVMPNDKLTIAMAMRCSVVNFRPFRIVHFSDTYSLENMYISEGLLEDALANPKITVDRQLLQLCFDGEGNIAGYKPV